MICGKEKNRNPKDADYYTGDEYFQKIYDMGKSHNGFPEVIVSHSFGIGQLRFENDAGNSNIIPEVSEKQQSFLTNIQTTFNLKRPALFAVYPPGGYISWHNNANAAAYNFIFTWSETGDGYWKHWDNKEKKMIKIPDVKGWQCKAGYFGSYNDPPEKLVYHTAKTNCLRMTIAFVLDKREISQGMQEWVIEDIQA